MFLIDGLPALGTAWWVEVTSPLSTTTASELQKQLLSTITEFEARYSRFQSTSLIGRLNSERKLEAPDTELLTILAYGQELFVRTNGYFNFLVGEVLSARGYDATYRFTPTAEPVVPKNPTTALSLSPEIIVLHEGMIDLGGYGKGYLIDLLANILRQNEVPEFLINGGGDIYGSTLNGKAIEIYLEHPTEPKTYVGTTELNHQGFAASSPFKRTWRHNEQTYTHIVGESSELFASFVVAKNATEADAFATAVMLMTDAEITELLRQESILAARFSPASQTVTNFNLPIVELK